MIPGEILTEPGQIELNVGRLTLTIAVVNEGDRPIQVGSHYHFAEANNALVFDRELATGYRLNIPAGNAVRFEPACAAPSSWWRSAASAASSVSRAR